MAPVVILSLLLRVPPCHKHPENNCPGTERLRHIGIYGTSMGEADHSTYLFNLCLFTLIGEQGRIFNDMILSRVHTYYSLTARVHHVGKNRLLIALLLWHSIHYTHTRVMNDHGGTAPGGVFFLLASSNPRTCLFYAESSVASVEGKKEVP